MPSPVYATLEDYRDEVGDDPSDAKVEAVLRRASRRLDEILKGVIYDTDEDDLPTDPDTADIFMRATCAQAEYMLDVGDNTGAKGRYVNASVGSVSRSLAQASAGVGKDRFAPEAISILQVEGVLPVNALTYW